MIVKHLRLGFSQELVQYVNVTAPEVYEYFPLYSLLVPSVAPGDIIQAATQFEIANQWVHTVSLAHVMMLNSSEQKTPGVPNAPGTPMAPCFHAGANVTPGGDRMHYGLRAFSGMTTVDFTGNAWISVWVYAKSDKGANGKLKVNNNGGLSALHFKA